MDRKRAQLEEYIEGHLLRRKYAEKTRVTYAYWVMRIGDFFGKYELSDFSEEDIAEFIKDIEDRQGLSSSTIKQAANALHFYFNTLGKRGIEVRGLRGKAVARTPRYVPTQEEILHILDSIRSKRTRLAVSLLYAAGLDIEEVLNIRIVDIDFERNSIKIPYKRARGSREAVLSEYLKPELYSYIRENNPKKWVFELKNGNKMSSSSIQKAIAKAVKALDIKHSISPKSLRYAYVKHLEILGAHLLDLLDELGMSHRSSFEYYARLGQKKEKISISPIDRRIAEDYRAKKGVEDEPYVSENRINELSEISQSKYDLTKLLELLREINVSNRHQMHLAVAMLVRAILDHIPPIFGFQTFSEVANNYQGGRSFKKQMQHLHNSLRNIADSYLHQTIRESEVLPAFTQVDFRAGLDVLLGEIVRLVKT